MPPINKITLTREIIETGQIHRLIQDGNYGVTFISDEERRNSLRKMFDNKDITEDTVSYTHLTLPTICSV